MFKGSKQVVYQGVGRMAHWCFFWRQVRAQKKDSWGLDITVRELEDGDVDMYRYVGFG